LVAHNSCVVKMRIAPILRVIRDAAPSDPELHELWELIQSDFYVNQRTIVESLERTGALASDLDVPGAADVLWTLNHPDVWLLLVGRRGWTPERFETWLGDTACAAPSPAAVTPVTAVANDVAFRVRPAVACPRRAGRCAATVANATRQNAPAGRARVGVRWPS
jgi:hypothetical protein